MSVERPTNWHPPSQKHGGENIPELYAQMLVDEVVGMMFAQTRNFELPIAQGMEALTAEKNQVSQRLKQSGQYFHQPGGSIFMDYKIMRGEAYRKTGQAMGEEDSEKANTLGYQVIKSSLDQTCPQKRQCRLREVLLLHGTGKQDKTETFSQG